MTEAWFIRHGESESNAGMATTGTMQVALTELGHEHAQKASRVFTTAPDLIVTSTYTRAIQTAQYTISLFPQVPVETWDTHEFNYLSRRGTSTMEERRPRARAYWERNDPNFVDGDDAESFATFIGRIQTMQNEILKHNGFIAIFGHGFFMKGLLWSHLVNSYDANSEYMRRFYAFHKTFDIPNGAVIKGDYQPGRTLLSGLLTEHLA